VTQAPPAPDELEPAPPGDDATRGGGSGRTAIALLDRSWLFLFLLALLGFFWATTPRGTFLTEANLSQIALSTSQVVLLAIGLTFVIVTGGIDLSIGSLMGVINVLSAREMVDMSFRQALAFSLLLLVLASLVLPVVILTVLYIANTRALLEKEFRARGELVTRSLEAILAQPDARERPDRLRGERGRIQHRGVDTAEGHRVVPTDPEGGQCVRDPGDHAGELGVGPGEAAGVIARVGDPLGGDGAGPGAGGVEEQLVGRLGQRQDGGVGHDAFPTTVLR